MLKLIGSSFPVSGLAWLLKGAERRLSPKAFAAKVLCQRHNNALELLDREAKNLFGILRRFRADAAKQLAPHEANDVLVSGDLIERWMLKALVGLIASRSARKETDERIELSPPRHVLEILFGDRSFPENIGLFVDRSAEPMLDPEPLTFVPTTWPGPNDITTMLMQMEGVIILTSIGEVEPIVAERLRTHASFRPAMLVYNGLRRVRFD